jgi:hypothetical protein
MEGLRFDRVPGRLDDRPPTLPKAVIRAALGQTAELAAQIQKETKNYEQLQKTQAKELHIFSLHDLRVAPIRYRIAAHMTISTPP